MSLCLFRAFIVILNFPQIEASMKSIPIITTILFLVSFATLQAEVSQEPDLNQIKHPVKPMLWKVEGKGMKKPSYLFGTYYSADPRVTTFHPLVAKAFKQSDVLYDEYVSPSDENREKNKGLFMRHDGKSLTEVLGLELTLAFSREIKKAHADYQVRQFSDYKIWYLASMVPYLADDADYEDFLSAIFLKKAEDSGKEIKWLEMTTVAPGSMDQLSIDEQKEYLRCSLAILREERKRGLGHHLVFLNAYLRGDVIGSEKMLNSDRYLGVVMASGLNEKMNKMYEEVYITVITKKIKAALKKSNGSSMFFSINSRNMLGSRSVCDRLRNAGYTVTRVQ